ncbi:MAG TPA: A/G-specific adenine glycosylase [Candidatus Acidoferrales bacterium]|nr:A/G-specific adenine glycosylase [Candidatus Acidoferrales bacterium]
MRKWPTQMDQPSKSHATFRNTILRWYRANRREYPWRRDYDPYRVWLAEVMLQQTRIAAVISYYEKFLRRFPHVKALARGSEHEVLRCWAGLGYYSRARNLHRAAREIAKRHGGVFPRTLDEALALPGIGRYTAAAVLSIAYGAPHAVVDGNVARVLARLGAVRGDLRAPGRWPQLAATAQELLAVKSARDWNQAMMELGQTICTPKSPRCGECPVREFCKAHERGLVDKIPERRRKRVTVRQRIAAAVLLDPRGRTLLVRDPGAHDDVLFSRMWQFPALESARDGSTELITHLHERYGVEAAAPKELSASKHGVTFRDITLMPFLFRVESLPAIPRSRRLPLAQIARVPLSSATRKIAESALRAINSEVTDEASPRSHRGTRMLN